MTGAEHRARIELPNGFEFKLAEMGNSAGAAWPETSYHGPREHLRAVGAGRAGGRRDDEVSWA